MNTCISVNWKSRRLAVFLVASAMTALGVWVLVHDQGKNMLSTVPLFSLLTLVCAPPVSAGCAAGLWRDEGQSHWIASLATVLALLQLLTGAFIIVQVVHYS